jgi:hypothetical protein
LSVPRAAAGISGSGGVGASIGVSLARNFIGWDPSATATYDYTSDTEVTSGLANGKKVGISTGIGAGDAFQYVGTALTGTIDLRSQDYYDTSKWTQLNVTSSTAETKAYIKDSTVTAIGALTATATATQTINAKVGAGSAAISGGGVGVGLSGAGASSTNKVTMLVSAYIDGDGANGISASSVSFTASDASTIDVLTEAVSIAGSFGGTGVSLSIGVAIAKNEIGNDVEAYITNADQGVTTATGDLTLTANERARIRSKSPLRRLQRALPDSRQPKRCRCGRAQHRSHQGQRAHRQQCRAPRQAPSP